MSLIANEIILAHKKSRLPMSSYAISDGMSICSKGPHEQAERKSYLGSQITSLVLSITFKSDDMKFSINLNFYWIGKALCCASHHFPLTRFDIHEPKCLSCKSIRQIWKNAWHI